MPPGSQDTGSLKKQESYDSKEAVHSASVEVARLEDIDDGIEYPTEEEKQTLRRAFDTIPWGAY
ncbi:hypothetical protein V5O48_018540, partial [Marasmius crinis-equi]